MVPNWAFVQHDVHRALLREALYEAVHDPEVTGLLLTGSVARGDACPGSDLDLKLLLRDGCRRPFSAEVVQGILVERSYADLARARRKLAEDAMQVYAYLDGRILYDPERGLQALSAEADERFHTYRAPPEVRRAIAHWLTSARAKLEAAQNAGDAFRAAYVTAITSWKILEGVWAACDRPMPPGGAVWAHLSDVSAGQPALAQAIRRLFGPDSSGRVEAAIEIIDRVMPALRDPDQR